MDFGAAKAATITALAVTGTVIGSAQYTAPEQAMGKPTFASDLYSLGVTCIHLLTNIEPFDLFDVNESDWVWRDYLTVKVSDRLGQVLDKLLQQGTKKRFQTAQEVLDALQLTVKPTSIQTPQPTPQHDIALKSAKGVNYDQLEQLLKSGKWKEADQETAKKMLEVAGRTKEGCLDKNSIDNFPCEDLRTIDKLWVKYSSGRFGFSVQKNIWLEAGSKVDYETECKLGDRVGWRKNSSWMDYDDLAFSLQAPVGHLPVVVGVRAPVSWLAWFLGACAWVFVSFWVCFGVLVTFGFLFSLIWPDFTDMFIGLLGLVCVVGWGMVCWLGPLSDGWRSYRASRVGRSSLASRTAVSFNL